VIRERHHDVLRLATTQVPEILAVAEGRLVTHWLNQPFRQRVHTPQDVKKLDTTRSPGLNRLTSDPASSNHPDELMAEHRSLVHGRVP